LVGPLVTASLRISSVKDHALIFDDNSCMTKKGIFKFNSLLTMDRAILNVIVQFYP